MKHIWKLLLILVVSSISLTSFAAFPEYTNKTEFEKKEWNTCEVASDGCNTYLLQNQKITGGTRMTCENKPVLWTCLQYKQVVPVKDISNILKKRNEIAQKLSTKHQKQVIDIMEWYKKKTKNYSHVNKIKTRSTILKLLEKEIIKIERIYKNTGKISTNNKNLYLMLLLLQHDIENIKY